MKRLLLLTVVFLLVSSLAFAAAKSDYQVTGPVLQLTDDMIVVQKGKDRWEIARGPETKVTGDLKVGAKVTVYYKMDATKVEVKEAGKAPAKKK
jgi:hypothetical protein